MLGQMRRHHALFRLPALILALAVFAPALSVGNALFIQDKQHSIAASASHSAETTNSVHRVLPDQKRAATTHLIIQPGSNQDGSPLDDMDPTDRSQHLQDRPQLDHYLLLPAAKPQVSSHQQLDASHSPPLWHIEAPHPPPDA
ncbi:hypothetical protein [Lysinibacter sp. HNR]|uniref:hypothetical protein n=1 Tax=Lysinibacter sp. HNR TaxID=3031408 RepID=UPI002434DFC8|nr:hypothetical protein [Lysinibacter sp. HNR]WGD37060.1 hypothetical protein FrondiHNR_11545 [Lysinibacter sp. HNR]